MKETLNMRQFEILLFI